MHISTNTCSHTRTHTMFFHLHAIHAHIIYTNKQTSLVVTNEHLATEWSSGMYACSACSNRLYSSDSKFEGPCLWPSFRCSAGCETHEIYCKQCELFVGHAFDDGKETDTHPDAKWRHCVLSHSLQFQSP
mmetsp:Transcript_38829/g.57052  ORF Transcript_38829/g.57052 Transcript_38829/m.57052 type:complete len:130 (+) Transcript_38829:146-535(+)